MYRNQVQVRFDESWLGPLGHTYAAVRMASTMRLLNWDIVYAPLSPNQQCEPELRAEFNREWGHCLAALIRELRRG